MPSTATPSCAILGPVVARASRRRALRARPPCRERSAENDVCGARNAAILHGFAYEIDALEIVGASSASRHSFGADARPEAAYARDVRTVALALYADTLAAKASALAAQLERARDSLRQIALEREARRSLDAATIERLERLEVLGRAEPRSRRADVSELAADLAAVEALQAWVESQLFAAQEETSVLD
jgi:hypothetical protein